MASFRAGSRTFDAIGRPPFELDLRALCPCARSGASRSGALVAYAALILILQGIGLLLRDLFISGGMNQASASLLGFLIVGGVVGIIGAILIVKALDTLKKEPLTPTKTAETLKEDKEWVQSKVQ